MIQLGFVIVTAPIWIPLWIIGKIFQEMKYYYYENVTND